MPRESKAKMKERALKIMQRIEAAHPDARTELQWSTPFQLLVATILSAQCTDERVNQVTPDLFRHYPTPQTLAEADPAEVQEEIRSTGFYHNKTKSIMGAAKMVVEEFGGKVPGTMEEILRLPGVQRKTANVVLSNALRPDDPQGIVVDRHCHRVSQRLGFVRTTEKNPDKVEKVLMGLFPRDHWYHLGEALVVHGRYTCTARKPNCAECPVEDLCPKVGIPKPRKPAKSADKEGGSTAAAKR